MTVNSHEWVTAAQAWQAFTQEHPELSYPIGKYAFYNFMRVHRQPLIAADAIRFAKGRFWIAHISRFKDAAFACATGRVELPKVLSDTSQI